MAKKQQPKPVPFPHTRWDLAHNYLAYMSDPEDRAADTLGERQLVAYIQAVLQDAKDGGTKAQFMRIRQGILKGGLPLSLRQQNRFWYFSMMEALICEDWSNLEARIAEVKTGNDAFLEMELNRWRTTLYMNTHRFELAITRCEALLAYVLKHKRLDFSRGDYDSFYCHWTVVLSQAHFGYCALDDSRDDLFEAREFAENWVAANLHAGVKTPQAMFGMLKIEMLKENVSEEYVVLPLDTLLAATRLQNPDEATQTWVTLYIRICWQLAYNLLMTGRLHEPHNPLDMHQHAEDLAGEIMRLSETIPFLNDNVARLAVLRAEVLLSHTEFLPAPPDLKLADGMVDEADDLLEHAEQAARKLESHRELDELIAYMRLYAQFERARLSDDHKLLTHLLQSVKQMHHTACRQHRPHLMGRYDYLMGRILHLLWKAGEPTYDGAAHAFSRAARFFTREGNNVRAQEARDAAATYLF